MLKPIQTSVPRGMQLTVAQICRSMQFTSKFPYIKKKDLDDIQQAHGTSTFQKIKMYGKLTRHIYTQGYKSLRKDAEDFLNLKRKERLQNAELTKEEQALKKRMRQELHRMKALVVIQILPMSGPLLIYYLYTYPTSIPSWFCIDSLHEDYQMECIRRQKQAIQYFRVQPLATKNLDLKKMKLQDLKRLSELLFGHFQDGIVGYNKIMNKQKQYILHPYFSKLLMIRNIKNEFREDVIQHKQLESLSLQDRVVWKYKRVMANQGLLVFHKIQHQNEHTAQTQTPNKQQEKIQESRIGESKKSSKHND